MARAPVDGLPTGHYTANDALGDYEGGFVSAERSSGRSPSQPSEKDDTCLVGLRRSLARSMSTDESDTTTRRPIRHSASVAAG